MQVARVALNANLTRLLNRLKTQTLASNKHHTTARLTQITHQIRDLDGEIKAGIAGEQPIARAHHGRRRTDRPAHDLPCKSLPGNECQ